MSPVIEISSFSELNQLHPSVATLYHTFLVVWSSFGQDSDGFGIFCQIFDFYGNKMGGVISINTMIVGDQLYPIINPLSIPTKNFDVVWINRNDLSFSSQTFEHWYTVLNDETPFLKSGYLGPSKISQFGEKTDVSEAIFTKDGKYFLVGLVTGVLQIYDFGSLFVLKQIELSNATCAKMIWLEDSAIILDNLWKLCLSLTSLMF